MESLVQPDRGQPSYDLEQTVFFPLTGNPVGFHHLLLAECAWRQFPQLKQLVFLLSNGKHPDPTKAQAIADKHIRAHILQKAVAGFGNPQKSYVAKIAQDHQECLKLNDQNTSVSIAEFEQEHAVSLYEHMVSLKKHAALASNRFPLQWLVGGDLVNRMSNPHVFNGWHLEQLSKHCKFLIASRRQSNTQEALAILKRERAIVLDYQELHLARLPACFSPFLNLSSTRIRQTMQAEHALTCFLPKEAAQLIQDHQLFQQKTSTETMNEWEKACRKLEQHLENTARQLKTTLDQREIKGLPHTFALVETSTGGRMAATLASLSGISKHFKESVVLYDQPAKDHFAGQPIAVSAVSAEMATLLARRFQEKTQADYVLSETGMAGPLEGLRHSHKQGQCEMALATTTSLSHHSHQSSPFLSKKEHQLIFANTALTWILETL